MINSADIREHMEVVGSDDSRLGRVDHVRGDRIELAKMDSESGLKHHVIPLSWVELVAQDKVRLSCTKDEAKARWSEMH